MQLVACGLWKRHDIVAICWNVKVFRIYKGWSRISFSSTFTLSNVKITRGHTVKINKNRCCLDARCHFFSERVIERQNCLPQHIIDSTSLSEFKSGLDRLRSASIGFFIDQWSAKPYRPHLFCWSGIRCGHTWYVKVK